MNAPHHTKPGFIKFAPRQVQRARARSGSGSPWRVCRRFRTADLTSTASTPFRLPSGHPLTDLDPVPRNRFTRNWMACLRP